jgi:tryptophan synthase, alpha subunit
MSGARINLEARLRERRAAGAKLLVPYVTGGLGASWCDVVRAVADAGADAIEIGIPFSDPIMDGKTIQEASQRALDLGATPMSVLAQAATLDIDIPLVVMTYYNLVAHAGHERFAHALVDSHVAAAIVPDLPLDELDGWGDAAAAAGVETVLLASPTTTDERLRAICERSQGFVYGVSLLGVTGERHALNESAHRMGRRPRRPRPTCRASRRGHLHTGAGGRRRGRGRRGHRRQRARAPPPAGRRTRRSARVHH